MSAVVQDWTMRKLPGVELGGMTFEVELQDFEDGESEPMVWLKGARGGVYFLRGFLGDDTGLRQVISWKSGAPLRRHGNEVRVYMTGDVIETARRS